MPLRIGLVRHGHSAAQEVRDIAERAGHLRFTFEPSDSLAPLSAVGREQALRLGEWLREQNMDLSAVIASPYRRAFETAELVTAAARVPESMVVADESLQEIGWGDFEGLTRAGRKQFFPDQFAAWKLDKFHNGPPGGESWSRLAARVRPLAEQVIGMEGLVLLVCHEVTVKCLRGVLEELSPQQTLSLRDVPNASLTLYRRDGDRLVLELENFVPE